MRKMTNPPPTPQVTIEDVESEDEPPLMPHELVPAKKAHSKILEIRQKFTALDADKSGYLDIDAARQLMIALEIPSTYDVQKSFSEIDIGEQGKFCVDEFIYWYRLRFPIDPKDVINNLRYIFNMFDEDGNNELSKKEVRKVLKKMGVQVSTRVFRRKGKKRMRDIFKLMDIEHKGTVSFSNFLQWHKREYQQLHAWEVENNSEHVRTLETDVVIRNESKVDPSLGETTGKKVLKNEKNKDEAIETAKRRIPQIKQIMGNIEKKMTEEKGVLNTEKKISENEPPPPPPPPMVPTEKNMTEEKNKKKKEPIETAIKEIPQDVSPPPPPPPPMVPTEKNMKEEKNKNKKEPIETAIKEIPQVVSPPPPPMVPTKKNMAEEKNKNKNEPIETAMKETSEAIDKNMPESEAVVSFDVGSSEAGESVILMKNKKSIETEGEPEENKCNNDENSTKQTQVFNDIQKRKLNIISRDSAVKQFQNIILHLHEYDSDHWYEPLKKSLECCKEVGMSGYEVFKHLKTLDFNSENPTEYNTEIKTTENSSQLQSQEKDIVEEKPIHELVRCISPKNEEKIIIKNLETSESINPLSKAKAMRELINLHIALKVNLRYQTVGEIESYIMADVKTKTRYIEKNILQKKITKLARLTSHESLTLHKVFSVDENGMTCVDDFLAFIKLPSSQLVSSSEML